MIKTINTSSAKIGLFADPHYCLSQRLCNTRRPMLSPGKLSAAMEQFRREGVGLCICLGDLTDVCETQKDADECLCEIVQIIKSGGIPFFVIPGNHDYHSFSAEYFSSVTGSDIPPYAVDTNTHRLIFLDANYRSNMERFDIAGVDWKDSNLPNWQIEFLKDTLHTSPKPCIVFIHENLDPDIEINHVVKNAGDIRKIMEESSKVEYVIQGHYHKGHRNTLNGIKYITVPAMCEGVDNHYLILEL